MLAVISAKMTIDDDDYCQLNIIKFIDNAPQCVISVHILWCHLTNELNQETVIITVTQCCFLLPSLTP